MTANCKWHWVDNNANSIWHCIWHEQTHFFQNAMWHNVSYCFSQGAVYVYLPWYLVYISADLSVDSCFYLNMLCLILTSSRSKNSKKQKLGQSSISVLFYVRFANIIPSRHLEASFCFVKRSVHFKKRHFLASIVIETVFQTKSLECFHQIIIKTQMINHSPFQKRMLEDLNSSVQWARKHSSDLVWKGKRKMKRGMIIIPLSAQEEEDE